MTTTPLSELPDCPGRTGSVPPPLQGLRVVEISQLLTGPLCSMMLGDLGAEVIKIEPPGRGDEFRHYPPADPALDGEGTPFLWANRNKRSVSLDLDNAAGLRVTRDLIRRADIVVENLPVGQLDKLGLDYESCSADNSRLIYCSISGYRRTGQFSDRSAADPVAQAESGFMSMNGDPDQDGVRTASPIMEIATAIMASNAILAAILARKRTGQGQRVTASLFDTAVNMAGVSTMQHLMSGAMPMRHGNISPNTSPTGIFKAQDATFYISCSTTAIFQRLFEHVMERPDIAGDPDLYDRIGRLQHREKLFKILDETFATNDWAHWGPKLHSAGIAVGEVRTLAEAMTSAETRDRGLVSRIPHPRAGMIPNISLPYSFSQSPPVAPVAAPLLGQHTQSVLQQVLDLDRRQLEELGEQGCFGARANGRAAA